MEEGKATLEFANSIKDDPFKLMAEDKTDNYDNYVQKPKGSGDKKEKEVEKTSEEKEEKKEKMAEKTHSLFQHDDSYLDGVEGYRGFMADPKQPANAEKEEDKSEGQSAN